MQFLRRLFPKPAPTLEFVGMAPHFNQISEIQDGIDHPSYWHYPDAATMQSWVDQGHDCAYVYQSHWTYGERYLTYFFLGNPFNRVKDKDYRIPKTINKDFYEAMKASDPITGQASPGKSLSEVTESLIKAVC